jgi:hypothetical protein
MAQICIAKAAEATATLHERRDAFLHLLQGITAAGVTMSGN